ncbi:glycosyltransferase [Robbsia sp. Bb-Pol-6]|uniref:Glycosyltransferase n=1 Tax=Robbsia betulipollinis TaxID=2981849 RepID=A0ABT3ZME5_9BURK|nr:glycosyltransferase [Robbsia betulipollinis]MCY0387728.1 glycosyltransferase [Robbsia betulipollinis]
MNESTVDSVPGAAAAPSAPLRVLFHIVDFGRGGTETALIGWLRALPPRQFTLGLSIAYPTPEFEDIYRQQLPAGIEVHVLHAHPLLNGLHTRRREGRLGKLGRLARTVFASTVNKQWARRRIASIAADYDVIVDFDLSLRHLAGRFERPWIGISHFSFAARLVGRPAKIARLARQYARYDGIAVLNRAMAEEARELFGDAIRQVLMLPNAIDIEEIRRRAALPGPVFDKPYIVSVARLDEAQKDHATLFHAYARLLREGRADVDLVVVGDGPDRAQVEAAAQASGQGARIHFTGYLSNPHPVVAGSELLVLSTRYEGLGMVLVEALALGRPVVCSDCPTGPREVLDDGRAGILVPCGDAAALADALADVLTDPARRATLLAAAPGRADFYGGPASTERLQAYCSALLATYPGHPGQRALTSRATTATPAA